MFGKFDISWPKLGVAAPRARVGGRGPQPAQKFGPGPHFVGQLLSQI